MWKIRRLITQQNASALDTTPVDDPLWEITDHKLTYKQAYRQMWPTEERLSRGWGGGGGWGCSRPSSDNNTMEKDSERKKKDQNEEMERQMERKVAHALRTHR